MAENSAPPASPANNSANPVPETQANPRFSWPMRIFLSVLVFDIVFHSIAVLFPYKDWCKDELELARFPKPLPTWEEMEKLDAEGPHADGLDPVVERWVESADSVWRFFQPWPTYGVRKNIDDWQDGVKFGFCWLTTRLGFLEELVRFDQSWTMFSPNVGKYDDCIRCVLIYDDDTEEVKRLSCDPEDLTHYGHWFKEKILQYTTKVEGDWDARVGYCNLLAHRYPKSKGGAPLVTIKLYKVQYDYPRPGADAMKVMRRQNGPPGWEQKRPSWTYDVKTRKLKRL